MIHLPDLLRSYAGLKSKVTQHNHLRGSVTHHSFPNLNFTGNLPFEKTYQTYEYISTFGLRLMNKRVPASERAFFSTVCVIFLGWDSPLVCLLPQFVSTCLWVSSSTIRIFFSPLVFRALRLLLLLCPAVRLSRQHPNKQTLKMKLKLCRLYIGEERNSPMGTS